MQGIDFSQQIGQLDAARLAAVESATSEERANAQKFAYALTRKLTGAVPSKHRTQLFMTLPNWLQ